MKESSTLHDLSKVAIEVMRQYRHDMMNDLQLIRGFLQLNKSERVVDSIEQSVERAQKMTVFSDIPDSLVAFVLLEAQITFPLMDLELVTLPEVNEVLQADGHEPFDSDDSVAACMYPAAMSFRLRDLFRQIGSFTSKQDIRLYVDVELSVPYSIRILISGYNEDTSWMDKFASYSCIPSTTDQTTQIRMERMDTGFILTIQLHELLEG